MINWDALIESYKKKVISLLDSETNLFNSIKRKEIPDKSGVYAIFGKDSSLLYIGQSKNLKVRLNDNHLRNDKIGSAFRKNLSKEYHLESEKEITQHILNNCSFKYVILDEPKPLEYFAISILKPKLNR